jgi:hypothetical protein
MTKLSDTQLVILSAACHREGWLVLPLPAHLKGGAATKVVESLISKGLVEEVGAKPGEPVWRTDEGCSTTLVLTDAAFEALGAEQPIVDNAHAKPADAKSDAPATEDISEAPATAPDAIHIGDLAASDHPIARENAESWPTAPARRARADSKQAKLIEMLKRPEGATVNEIASTLGWRPHTVRGAIAGALKKKLGLEIASETIEGRGHVYRIIS